MFIFAQLTLYGTVGAAMSQVKTHNFYNKKFTDLYQVIYYIYVNWIVKSFKQQAWMSLILRRRKKLLLRILRTGPASRL